MKRCSVVGCGIEGADGDSLFCEYHRKNWIRYCIVAGIHEKNVPPFLTAECLKSFCKDGLVPLSVGQN